jgi:predicted glycogen debranching enzyme
MSEGMVANTTDSGEAAHNTVDATLWYLHAVGAYVERTGDEDLAAELAPLLDDCVQRHLDGTRFGIHVTDDGLLAQGHDGVALTWMDAVTDGCCHTPRAGKPVEVQALWINALGSLRVVNDLIRRDPDRWGLLEEHARSSFTARFAGSDHVADVVDGPEGTDGRLRPNLLLAASLPHGPGLPASSVEACRDALLTPLGLRTLAPDDPAYLGAHRGTRLARDAAYHQGTVWPWLLGPFVDACMATEVACPAVLDGVEAHLGEVGLGSISETADGDAPHGATGCPFQAWSVAEVLRVRRRWIDRLRP